MQVLIARSRKVSCFDARGRQAYGRCMTGARFVTVLLGLALTGGAAPVSAQPPPPPSGIEERLARLEEGQRSVEKRLDDLRAEMNRRFDDVNRRFEEMQNFMLWGYGVTFAGIFALIGFVLWDRRTALAPAVRRMDDMHEREQRLEAALRDYAARSPELAESLRKVGLL